MLQHRWLLYLVFNDSPELIVVGVSRPGHFNQRIKEVRVGKQLPFVFESFLEFDAGSLTQGLCNLFLGHLGEHLAQS